MIQNYVIFLLDGHTTNGIPIMVDTIKTYLCLVNRHYKENGLPESFDGMSESETATLLHEQKKFEDKPVQHTALTDKIHIKMLELLK